MASSEASSPDKEKKILDVNQLIKQLEEQTQNDFLGVRGNPHLIRFLAQHNVDHQTIEKVCFSDSCIKINKRGRHQDRDLIITGYAIYNFLPNNYKKPKREIPITALKGIVLDKNSDEMLLQVSNDYDYRISVVRKADVLQLVYGAFKELRGQKLSVRLCDGIRELQVFKREVKRSDSRGRTVRVSVPDDTHRFESSGSFSRAPSIAVQGWLAKKGVASTGWRRRYFRLTETNLLYYEPRLKGSILVERGGSIRRWKNKRISVDARETSLTNSPHHLRNILHDPERAQAFLDYAKSIYSPENVRFYLAVEEYKKLTDGSTEQKEAARAIYQKYVRPAATMETSAPLTVREDLGEEISADKISRTTFDTVQGMVLEQMKINEFTSYLQYSGKKKLESEDWKIKKELTKGEKDKESCDNCMASFSILKRRNFCRYCGDILCSLCLSKTTILPKQFGVTEPVRVCDMCHAILEDDAPPFAFSFASKSMPRPINLAGNDTEDLEAWLSVFREITKKKDKADKKKLAERESKIKESRDKLAKERSKMKLKDTPDKDDKDKDDKDDKEEDKMGSSSKLSKSKKHGHTPSLSASAGGVLGVALSGGGETADSETMEEGVDKFTHAEESSQYKEGWLFKEDSNTKHWRSRYMVLNKNRLYTYELVLKGSVSLAEGAGLFRDTTRKGPTLTSEDATLGGLLSESNFKYHITVSVKNRLYALAADSKEDRDKWVESMEAAIKKAAIARQMRSDDYAQAYAQAAPEGEVTFVFTDVQNSTNLWEAASQAMNKSLKIHDNLLRMFLKQFKGYEVKTEGDAFMVTFFNALDAIRWCLEVQVGLLNSKWPDEILQQPAASQVTSKNGTMVFNGIRIRMGMHVGFPTCRRNPITGRMDYFGPVVNRTARVADSGNGGQVVCTEEVHQKLVAALSNGTFNTPVKIDCLGKHAYKGLGELVAVYQLTHPELVERIEYLPPLRIKEHGKEEKKEDDSKEKDPRRSRSKTEVPPRASRLRHSSSTTSTASASSDHSSRLLEEDLRLVPLTARASAMMGKSRRESAASTISEMSSGSEDGTHSAPSTPRLKSQDDDSRLEFTAASDLGMEALEELSPEIGRQSKIVSVAITKEGRLVSVPEDPLLESEGPSTPLPYSSFHSPSPFTTPFSPDSPSFLASPSDQLSPTASMGSASPLSLPPPTPIAQT